MEIEKAQTSISNEYNEKIIDRLICEMKKKDKINIVKWKPTKQEYPEYMLLSGDKGILAYINFYIVSDQEQKEFIHDYNDLARRLSLAISDLDRPVFNIYYQTVGGEDRICFETYEQIRDIIYNNTARIEKDYSGRKIFKSNKLEMGFQDELISIFFDMKKNSVKVS